MLNPQQSGMLYIHDKGKVPNKDLNSLLIINYRRYFPLSYFVRQKFSNILNTTQIPKRGIFPSFSLLNRINA